MNPPHRPLRPAADSSGLTLLEIVISVTVVAALLLASFSGLQLARQRAADTKCLFNLRATGQAALYYIADRQGVFFPSKFWYSRVSTAERSGLRDYLGFSSTAKSTSPEFLVDTVLTCPRLKAECPAKFPNMLNRCFTMNRFLIGKDPNAADELVAGPNPGSPQRLANVPHPARMWAFMDGATGSKSDASEFATIASSKSVATSLLYPHQQRQNIVFMDGHVESWTEGMIAAPPSFRNFWGDLTQPE